MDITEERTKSTNFELDNGSALTVTAVYEPPEKVPHLWRIQVSGEETYVATFSDDLVQSVVEAIKEIGG